MGATNRVEIELSYRPAARLQRVAESIPGLLKILKIPSLAGRYHEPIPTRFLVHKDCSKNLAQDSYTKFKKSSGFRVIITDMHLHVRVHDAHLNNLTRYCSKLSLSCFRCFK